MSRPRALLFFDYTDPLSYLLDRGVAAREQGSDILVERWPYELNPPPGALLDPEGDTWGRRWDEAVERAPALALPPRRPSIVPWTRKAHELALHARTHDRGRKVRQAIFEAFLLHGRDIGRIDVLVELAVAAGLDLTATRSSLDVDHYAPEVATLRLEAERLKVHRVPTLLVGRDRIERVSDEAGLTDLLRKAGIGT